MCERGEAVPGVAGLRAVGEIFEQCATCGEADAVQIGALESGVVAGENLGERSESQVTAEPAEVTARIGESGVRYPHRRLVRMVEGKFGELKTDPTSPDAGVLVKASVTTFESAAAVAALIELVKA